MSNLSLDSWLFFLKIAKLQPWLVRWCRFV